MQLLVLTHWRDMNGYSQFEAGRLLGVSAAQVCRYESGKKRIPPEKVPAVSAVTGIPPELLRPDVYRAMSRDEGERMLQSA
jgi:DNA-binding transcriptional regulator YdaS (Cro superfamily)